MYLIISGRVRIYTVSEMGQEVAVTLFGAGDFFGELALLDGQPRSASAVPMAATTTLMLERAAFLDAVQACPPIASAALTALSRRLRRSTVQAEHLASLSASQRVVQQLLCLVADHGTHGSATAVTELRVTQHELASLSGTTRETVNRVLSQLRDQGIVQLERARIIVRDVSGLEQALA